MKKSRSGFYLLLATIVTFLSFFAGTISAQVTVTNPGNTTPGLAASYLTLADAITALNTQTAISGPVTITLDPGNPQTNPAGGYAITASLSGASAVNQVTITGSGNTITAPSPAGTAGALNDAIFKFIGADFMTLSNFVLNENAANTTTAAGTNNMVEWGVAVLYASTTNGAQNITIQNNTIDLNRTYQNSFGIYSNSTHSATAVTTNATATTAAGGNSGLKIYSNNITDVNNGIVIVGPTAAADQNTGVEIGGTALTANTLTNFGTTGTFSGYANVSGTVNGILLRNTNGFTVSFNSINSSVGGTTVGTLNGIQLAAASNAPTGTYTNNINSNVISLRSGLAGGAINGINIPSGSASATSTLNVNNNDFNTFGHTVSGTGIIIFILNASTFQFSNINSNTFTNITVNTTGNVTFISNSMNAPASGTKTVNSNSIVTAFSKTGAGGTVSLYTDGGSSTSTTAVTNNNNNFSNITVTGATTISGWFNNDGTSATPPKTITGNTFSNWTGGTSSISVLQSNFGGTANISNNTISNISGQSTITGLFVGGSGTIAALTMASNSITGLTSSGTGGTVTGISNACPATVTNINNNTLNGYSSTSSVVGLVNSGGTTANIFKNTICNLASSGVSSTVFGLSVTGGTTVNASNNRIADLRATAANAANPLVGMNLTGGTTINAYYNTVHLNGTSAGAAFGSSAVSASTSPTVNLRNNIFINLSTANTTGFTVAYRRSSTTLTSYAAASNNNIFYAGTPSASNLIYYDGTNSDQTIGAFKTRVSPRDGLSQTENVPFLSTACGNADFLKVNTATPTLAEGNGATIALFTDDFEGDIRNATTPDVGADEFSGIPIILVTINSVSASPSGNLCTAAARTITANTTAGGTTITSVTLNYSFNGVAQSPIAMTGGDPNTGQTSNWTAVIPVATPANAVVTWSVSAVDGITSKLSTGTSYQDEPLTGFTGSIAANLTTVCSGSPAILTATFVTTGVSKVLGAGSTTSTSTAASFFPGGWGGAKTQYIVKASELNTIGLAAGPITSLAFEATSSGQTYQGFTVQIGHTAATVMTTTFLATPMTQVYKGTLTDDGYTPIVGVNNLAFGTGTGSSSSFTWDGTSNLVISICWSRVPAAATATASSIRVDPAGFTCSAYDQTDNATPAAECATAAGDGTGSNRPKFTFVGNGSATLATVTWNDGTSNIGTGNPFTVNPTTTTTYSAIGTDANGCTVTSTGITINTIALPAGPSTGPSSQCGTGVPTVFASGTSDGNYRWYTVPSGGTAIPGEVNSVLGTYSISSTTTFYVAITNGTCESLRTPVLATVNAPDAVSASSNGPVCANSPLQLTATVTSNTNGNVYNYSWSASPSIGSGIPTTQSGGTGTFGTPASTSVTPTTGGTYTYTVSATDGTLGCSTSATVTVTVNAQPVISSATATPNTVCSGDNVVLTATTTTTGPGFSSSIGTGTSTTGTSEELTAFCNRWVTYQHQAIFTAAELTAAGLFAGNLTSIKYNIISVGDASNTSNFTVKIGNTANSALTAFITSGLTTVFNPATYTHAIGMNTITFNTPFAWDGTSNIVVDVTHGGIDAIFNAQTTYTTMGANMQAFAFNGNPTATLTLNRLNVIFGGITGTTGAGTLAWEWNPGAISGNTTTVNPTSTTTYTVSGTDGNGCVQTANVAVTVNPIPAQPTGTPSTQCGTAIPTASVSSNSGEPTPIFKWYTVPTGGTALQTDVSTTFLSSISTATTFYVSEISAFGCEGDREPVLADVATPDAVVANATPLSLCLGGSVDLTTSHEPIINAAYDYTWTSTAGSGITTGIPAAEGATTTVTPTVAGTYTYTVSAIDNDNGCTTTATVVVTVNALPVITSAVASPTTVCAGQPVTLTAQSIIGGAGTSATIGSGTGFTSASNQPTAFCNRWAQYWAQTIYTAAELSAAGLTAGPITAITYNTSSQGDANNNTNFSLRIGTTASTTLSAFVTTGLTTVVNPTTYTHVIGLNTITFDNAFVWDGTSNIIVDQRHDGVDNLNNAQTEFTTAAGNVNISAVTSTTSGTTPIQTLVSNATVTPSTSTTSLNIKLAGIVGVNQTSSYSWVWNPGAVSAGTTGIATVNPTSTTTYTATATANGCSTDSDPVTVTVNPVPVAPTTNSPVTRCGPGSVTLTATGSGGTLNWYNVPTGGTSLNATGSYPVTVTASTTFYVDETSAAGCTGPRAAVTVTVTAPPTLAITPSGATTFCAGGSVGLDAATGSDPSYVNFSWAPPAGLSATSGASVTANPSVTTTYTVTADDGGSGPTSCANTATITITVNPNPVITSATASPATICVGGTSNLIATSVNAISGSANVGTATTSIGGDNGNPYRSGNGTGNQIRTQLLYTAAELTAAGITTGNITSLGLTTTGFGGTVTGFTIKMGATSATSLSAAFETTSMTTVFTQASFTAVLGLNNHVFSVPFNWNGSSNIIIDFCQTNSVLGTNTVDAYTPSFTSNVHLAGSTTSCSATSGVTVAAKPVITFGAQVGTDVTNSLNWEWNPGAIAGSTVPVTPSATTSYTVTATNPVTNCATTFSPVTVSVLPVGANATATPATAVCAGTSVTLAAGATGGGPFTYAWSDGTATVYPTTATIAVTPTVTTTYTVTVTDACSNSTTSSVTVNVNSLPSASIQETGPISVCTPGTQVLTAVTDAASPSYQWTLNGTNIPSATSATYTVTGVSTGTYRVVVTNTATTCVSAPSAGVVVNINPVPTAVSITPSAATICLNGSQTLTASGGAIPPTSTTFTSGTISVAIPDVNATGINNSIAVSGIPPGAVIDSVVAQFSVTHTFTEDLVISLEAPNGQIFNLAGGVSPSASGSAFASTRITSNTSAPALSTGTAPYTGTFKGDGRTSGFQLAPAILPTTGSFSSLFTVPNGTWKIRIHDDESIGSGTLTNWNLKISYKSAPVTWSWAPPAGLNTTTGATVIASPTVTTTYTATATNTFGCSTPGTATVTVVQPFVSATPGAVSGPTNVCPFIGLGNPAGLLTYSVPQGPVGTVYSWIVPPTTTLVSGQGTNTITLLVNTGFIANANKLIRVRATEPCGTISAERLLYLLAQFPNTPGPISGPTDACPLLGNSATYSVAAVPGASAYIWTAQSGTTITPAGPGTQGNTVTISFPTGFTTSAVTVQTQNDCGVSGIRSLTITRNNPSTPSLIAGPTNVCANIAPGGTPATYTVTNTPGTTYTWTVPNNVIGLTGQGTNTISFTYPAAFTGGTVQVLATNGCGSSGTRSLSVTKLNPATPSVIDVIQTAVCPNRVYTYTLASMPANATSILWTVPTASGAILVSGQGTTSITVSYPATAVQGVVTAQAVNNCGVSVTRESSVKLPACPVEPFTKGTLQPATTPVVAVADMQVDVFPNPTVSDFKLRVLTASKEIIHVRVLDAAGRAFKQFTLMPYETMSLGKELRAGAYIIEVRQGKEMKSTKVLKF